MLRTLCDEGHHGTDRAAALRAATPSARSTAPSSTRSPPAPEPPPAALLHARARRRRARRPLQPRPLPAAEPCFAEAETFACGPPALLDAVRGDLGQRPRAAPARRELRAAQPAPRRRARRRARSASPAPASRSPTAAPRCSSRPRLPASRRSPAAGWASATPAPAASSSGTVRNLLTGEISSAPDEEIQLCVRAPLGDVVARPLNATSTKGNPMSTPPRARSPLTPEQLDALRRGARRDPPARHRRPRRARRQLHPPRDPRPARARGRRPRPALGRLLPAGLARRHGRPLALQDPRQHGDRPQRDARPVRLDERPGALGQAFEWDNACPADQWRHSHNYMHHTHTNIVGKDRDIGYGVLRMSEEQRWRPYYLGNPVYAVLLALFFQYGVALHDLEVERLDAGEATSRDKREMLQGDLEKGPPPDPQGLRRSSRRSRGRLPLPRWPATLTANLVRNVWSFTIIFCGHFPEGTHEFTEEETEDETPRPVVLPPAARLGQPRPAASPSTSSPATSASRSSTTSSPTCRPTATRRSRPRCARSASATASPTTSARSASSSAASSRRSAGWRCRTRRVGRGAASQRPKSATRSEPQPRSRPERRQSKTPKGRGEATPAPRSSASSSFPASARLRSRRWPWQRRRWRRGSPARPGSRRRRRSVSRPL